MSRIRASLQRAAHNAGPIAVSGMFLLLAVVMFLLLRVSALSGQIVSLQRTQAENSANGRTLLAKVLSLSEQIAAFSDPNSQAAKDQREKTAQALQQFDQAQRLGRADQLKKIAQMFTQCSRLPCDPAVVNRILAQPVPVPTFGAIGPTPSTPMRSVGASPPPAARLSPSPSPTSCPGLQVAPLNIVKICVPP